MTNVDQINTDIQLFADFDSANMARYERVTPQQQQVTQTQSNDDQINTNEPQPPVQLIQLKIDAEFNVWTRPDCEGTPYENANRTWFYFGVRGGHGKLLKFNIMNLNRQGRLFEMGMLPVFKTVPGNEKWSRIYSKPTWQNVDLNFQMSFTFRNGDKRGSITYFAFCFPHSYNECQNQLLKYDIEFRSCATIDPEKCTTPDAIYYHRELLCYSLDYRRVDLITISACNNMSVRREPRFDHNLFPDEQTPRAYAFDRKRVFVLTSRVHPGETPASFVFNGFLEFILNRDDPRAKALRKQFVFKLIPILNPDGVARGHYRTDQMGANLNRFYLDPNFKLHPSIYAAKALIVFHHVHNRTSREQDGLNFDDIFQQKDARNNEKPIYSRTSSENNQLLNKLRDLSIREEGYIGNENSDNDEEPNDDDQTFDQTQSTCIKHSPHLSDPRFLQINPLCSGIAFYIDLHGHAAKRGCFIYGNSIDNELYQVENVLFTKLITFNTQHFDFDGCNFSIKNMYFKDKREGLSKEGSGRVALYKTIGLIHSYTLECCYACGRCMNTITSAVNTSMYTSGRISPPLHSDMPPKFQIEHYKSVGKALGIAALDICELNPCSRIPNTTFGSLESVRNWVKFYIRSKSSDYAKSNLTPGTKKLSGQSSKKQSDLMLNTRRFSSSIAVQSANRLSTQKKLLTAPHSKSITPLIPLQTSQSDKRVSLVSVKQPTPQRKSNFTFLKTMPTIQVNEEANFLIGDRNSSSSKIATIVDDDIDEYDQILNKKPISNRSNTSREPFPLNKANVIHLEEHQQKDESHLKKTAEIISARVTEQLSKLVRDPSNVRKFCKTKSTPNAQKPQMYNLSLPLGKKLSSSQNQVSKAVGVSWTVSQHMDELQKQHFHLTKLIRANTRLNLKRNRMKQATTKQQQQEINRSKLPNISVHADSANSREAHKGFWIDI